MNLYEGIKKNLDDVKSDEFLVNKTPYGFTEVYHNGYVISDVSGDITVNIDGNVVKYDSIDEAISAVTKLKKIPNYSLDGSYDFVRDSYSKRRLNYSNSLIRTSDVNEVKKLFNEPATSVDVRREFNLDKDNYDENGNEWIWCARCGYLTPKSECKKELTEYSDWLCKYCQDELASKGEQLVYEEGE